MRSIPFEFRPFGPRRGDASRLRGVLRLPDDASFPRRLPVIVHGPGWLGLADAPHYARYHEAFVAHGFAVVAFDYAGFGQSDGVPGWLLPSAQIRDIQAAISTIHERAILDRDRIGLFGMGGTGAGNALAAAARSTGVRCVVAYHVVADGADWLRCMRTEREWHEFLSRVETDRVRREAGHPGEMVDPRTELMVAAPERRANAAKREVDAKLPTRFHLASAADLLSYRPLDEIAKPAHMTSIRTDAAGRVVEERQVPRTLATLVATVAGDRVTPEAHAVAAFERSAPPKRLVRIRGVGHYEADARCFDALAREFVDWFERWLGPPEHPARGVQAVVHTEAETVEIAAPALPV